MEIIINEVFKKISEYRALANNETEYLLEYYIIQEIIGDKLKFKHYKFLSNNDYNNLVSTEFGTSLIEEFEYTNLNEFSKDNIFPEFHKNVKIESKNTENFYSEVLSKEQVSNSVLDKHANLNANLKIYLTYAVKEIFDINTDSFTGEKEIYGVSYSIDGMIDRYSN